MSDTKGGDIERDPLKPYQAVSSHLSSNLHSKGLQLPFRKDEAQIRDTARLPTSKLISMNLCRSVLPPLLPCGMAFLCKCRASNGAILDRIHHQGTPGDSDLPLLGALLTVKNGKVLLAPSSNLFPEDEKSNQRVAVTEYQLHSKLQCPTNHGYACLTPRRRHKIP